MVVFPSPLPPRACLFQFNQEDTWIFSILYLIKVFSFHIDLDISRVFLTYFFSFIKAISKVNLIRDKKDT